MGLIVTPDQVAESLENVVKVVGFVRNGSVYLRFFGEFSDVDVERLLFSQVSLSIAHPDTGDLDEYEAYTPFIQRSGDSIECLIQPRSSTFAFHQLPVRASADGVLTNLAFVVVSYGSKEYPRESWYSVGIRIERKPKAI